MINDNKQRRLELSQLQALPLELKIMRTKKLLSEWCDHYGSNNVYVSFSGGKDSSVLADICASVFSERSFRELKLVFVNTGLEFPDIVKFTDEYAQYLQQKYGIKINLVKLKPKYTFVEVIKKYGYPLISKEASECVANARKYIARGGTSYKTHYEKIVGQGNYDVAGRLQYEKIMAIGRYATRGGQQIPIRTAPSKDKDYSMFNMEKYKPLLDVDFNISNMCCSVMKKTPVHKYNKENGFYSITAQMASESRLRMRQWYFNGCNGFDMKNPISNPMSFWLEQDVLHYIKDNNLPLAKPYGEIVYEVNGTQYETNLLGDTQDMKLTTTGAKRTGCMFCLYGAHCKGDERLVLLKKQYPAIYDYIMRGGAYDENGIWQPYKGLGYKHIIDEVHKIYGNDFIKIPK